MFNDGLSFLERFIEDNSIAYAQDKAKPEWSFNNYTKDARLPLKYLHRRYPTASPSYLHATRKPKERWEYCQTLLKQAVLQFRSHLEKPNPQKVRDVAAKLSKSRPKAQTKANRKMATQPGSAYAPDAVNRNVALGASPRGIQGLMLAAKVQCLLGDRFAVSTDDVMAVARPVLRHRAVTNFQAQASGRSTEALLDDVLAAVSAAG